jgi:hypothetical protein
VRFLVVWAASFDERLHLDELRSPAILETPEEVGRFVDFVERQENGDWALFEVVTGRAERRTLVRHPDGRVDIG